MIEEKWSLLQPGRARDEHLKVCFEQCQFDPASASFFVESNEIPQKMKRKLRAKRSSLPHHILGGLLRILKAPANLQRFRADIQAEILCETPQEFHTFRVLVFRFLKTATETSLMLSNSQLDQWQRDGFLLVRSMYDGATIERLKAFFADLATRRDEMPHKFVLEQNVPDGAPPLSHIRKINAMQEFDEVLPFYGPDSPAARVAAQIIGANDLNFSCSSFTKPANHGSETPWHQDQALWTMVLPTAVSCWIALDQCTTENGCLQFVRGAHLEGYHPHVSTDEQPHPHIPKSEVPQDRVAVLEMEPGDGVFFGGLAWHFSEPNRSPQRRLGMTGVFNSPVEQDTLAACVNAWALNRIDGYGAGQKAPFSYWPKRAIEVGN